MIEKIKEILATVEECKELIQKIESENIELDPTQSAVVKMFFPNIINAVEARCTNIVKNNIEVTEEEYEEQLKNITQVILPLRRYYEAGKMKSSLDDVLLGDEEEDIEWMEQIVNTKEEDDKWVELDSLVTFRIKLMNNTIATYGDLMTDEVKEEYQNMIERLNSFHKDITNKTNLTEESYKNMSSDVLSFVKRDVDVAKSLNEIKMNNDKDDENVKDVLVSMKEENKLEIIPETDKLEATVSAKIKCSLDLINYLKENGKLSDNEIDPEYFEHIDGIKKAITDFRSKPYHSLEEYEAFNKVLSTELNYLEESEQEKEYLNQLLLEIDREKSKKDNNDEVEELSDEVIASVNNEIEVINYLITNGNSELVEHKNALTVMSKAIETVSDEEKKEYLNKVLEYIENIKDTINQKLIELDREEKSIDVEENNMEKTKKDLILERINEFYIRIGVILSGDILTNDETWLNKQLDSLNKLEEAINENRLSDEGLDKNNEGLDKLKDRLDKIVAKYDANSISVKREVLNEKLNRLIENANIIIEYAVGTNYEKISEEDLTTIDGIIDDACAIKEKIDDLSMEEIDTYTEEVNKYNKELSDDKIMSEAVKYHKENADKPVDTKHKVKKVVKEKDQSEKIKRERKSLREYLEEVNWARVATIGGIAAVILLIVLLASKCHNDKSNSNSDVTPTPTSIEDNRGLTPTPTFAPTDTPTPTESVVNRLSINDIDINDEADLRDYATALNVDYETLRRAISIWNIDYMNKKVFEDRTDVTKADLEAGILANKIGVRNIVKTDTEADVYITKYKLQDILNAQETGLDADDFESLDIYTILDQLVEGLNSADTETATKCAMVLNEITARSIMSCTILEDSPLNTKYVILGVYNANKKRIEELTAGRRLGPIYGDGTKIDDTYGYVCVEELAKLIEINAENFKGNSNCVFYTIFADYVVNADYLKQTR